MKCKLTAVETVEWLSTKKTEVERMVRCGCGRELKTTNGMKIHIDRAMGNRQPSSTAQRNLVRRRRTRARSQTIVPRIFLPRAPDYHFSKAGKTKEH